MAGVKVDITGDDTGLIAALNASKAACSEAAAAMSASFESVAGAFEKIQTAMIAFTAILAGGKAFGEAINASVQTAASAQALGRQLGITATQASILKVAMDENFVSTEAVQGASNKIATTLKKNEHAFVELGVATRDANGNFRNSFDIMTDVNARLLTFKEGTDRNVEGMKIYGRSWQEIAPTIRITGQAMEEAKVKAESLGLIVGKEGVAQSLAYRTAMAGVHTVFDALEKVIGDALVPTLTKLAQWFVSIGPQAVAITRAAIYSVYAAFSYLGEAGQVMIDALGGALVWLGAQFMRLATTAAKVLMFDFSGAKAAWAEGTANIEAKSAGMVAKIKADMKQAEDARDSFFESQDAKQTATEEKTGAASTGGDGKEKSQLAALEAALEEKKALYAQDNAAHGQFLEFGKQAEIDYWQAVLGKVREGSADYIAIEKKIAIDTVAIRKQAFEGELAQLKNQEAEHKNNLAARLVTEQQYAEKVKTAYGENSKQYADAQRSIIETKRSIVDQERKLDDIRLNSVRDRALGEIAIEEETAKHAFALEQTSLQQYLAQQRDFENRKSAIREDALQQQLARAANDPESSPVKKAEIDAQLEALERQHQQNLLKIKEGGDAQELSLSKSLQSGLQSGFRSAFQGIVDGTMSMGQAFKSVFKSMLSAITDFFAQWAAKALIQHVIAMTQNKQEAMSNAAVAATGGAKSAAAIPYVGWALAIGAAAAIFAAASSYSALGGFDVPSGLNPLTQLHGGEMVLPQPLAERVRGMTDTGDTSASNSDAPVHVHFPGKEIGNFFMMHKDDLHAAIRHLVRSGQMSG